MCVIWPLGSSSRQYFEQYLRKFIQMELGEYCLEATNSFLIEKVLCKSQVWALLSFFKVRHVCSNNMRLVIITREASSRIPFANDVFQLEIYNLNL